MDAISTIIRIVLRGDGNGRPTSVKLVAPWTAVTDPGLRPVVNAVVHEPQKQWTSPAWPASRGSRVPP